MLLDESLIYLKAYHINYLMENNKWVLLKEIDLPVQRCSELPNRKQKEDYYNISLEMWNCINFDNITMGGNWDGNFV
jgi:hypothetical protein